MGSRRSGKGGNWSAQDLSRLRVLYPYNPPARVAALLGRSKASVQRRASALFTRPHRRGAWTGDEDLQLRMSYGVLDVPALALVLARSGRDVQERIGRLRRSRRRGAWSSAEQGLLKRLYSSRSDQDLEVCLSRPARQIVAQAALLCLQKDKRFLAAARGAVRMPRWTSGEEARLRELYPARDNLEIARALGRSVVSVANKASQLGLRKSEQVLQEMGRRNVAVRYARGRAGDDPPARHAAAPG